MGGAVLTALAVLLGSLVLLAPAAASASPAEPLLAFGPDPLPALDEAVPYEAHLVAEGAAAPVTWTALELPPGLSLTPSGLLSGTLDVSHWPSLSSGVTTVSVEAVDQAGVDEVHDYALPYFRRLRVSTEGLEVSDVLNFHETGVGVMVHQEVFATGGGVSRTWSVVGGGVAPGLELTPSGVLQGAPTDPGTFDVTVRVADERGGVATALIRQKVRPRLAITTTTLPDAKFGRWYDSPLAYDGLVGDEQVTLVSGTLPTGMVQRHGGVEGTPTEAGTFPLRLAVFDRVGRRDERDLTLVVLPPVPPEAPTWTLTLPSDRSLSLQWQRPDDGGMAVTSYVVDVFQGTTKVVTKTVAGDATGTLIGGLQGHATYTATVRAVTDVGSSPPSASSGALRTLWFQDPITEVHALASATSAVVTWAQPLDDGAEPVTSYLVSAAGGSGGSSATVGGGESRAVLTGLVPGTHYAVSVTPWYGDLSGGAIEAPEDVVVRPGPPAPIFGTPTPGATSIKLTWSQPSNPDDPVIRYELTPTIGGVAQPAVTLGPSTSTTVTGLVPGTTYAFRLVGVSARGPSDPSAPMSVAVGAPSNPGFQSAQPAVASARVGWTAPSTTNGSPVSGYVVTPYRDGLAQAAQSFAGTATTATVVGLTDGARYTFRVAARNGNGIGAQSGPTAAITVGAPSAPAYPVAVPELTSVRLSWVPGAANSGPISGYRITPLLGGVPAMAAIEFRSAASHQTITGLDAAYAYSFRIEPFSSVGTGPASTSVAVKLGAPQLPGFPSAASGPSAPDGSAVVRFSTPPGNAAPVAGYIVTPVRNGSPQATQTFVSPLATSLSLSGLTIGSTYSFRIAAFNAIGTGPYITTNSVVIGTPTAPGFPAAQPGNGTAKVAWSASADNGSPLTAYKVTPYVGTVAQTTRTFTGTATTVTVAGLTNGITYTFKVQAVNAVGSGLAATTALSTKVGTPTTPVFPSAKPGNASAVVSAGAPVANASAITGYVVTPMVGTSARPSQTFTGTATTWNVTGLTNGTTYTFRVSAINAIGTGPYATTAAIKVGVPGQPTGVTAAKGVQQATVSWVAPAANGGPLTGYVVTPYVGSVAQPARSFDASVTSRVITGLVTGTSYTFKVQAVNAVGTGAASSASAAVVPT